MHTTRPVRTPSRRGAALYVVLVATLVFVGMTLAMITVGLSTKREREESIHHAQRRLLAEAGLADSLVKLTAGGSGVLGSVGSPVAFGSGAYYVDVTDHGDQTFTIESTGVVGGVARRVRCVARDSTLALFDHAIFAGNSDRDPTYSLNLGGSGTEADDITGDLYSGGDMALGGDATVAGTVRAAGSISGTSGEEGVAQSAPDIGAMQYETNHDIDVAGAFATGSPTYAANALGGSAWQLPEDNPAHIFRMNPSDRSAEYLSTAKNDYFLEDPYERVSSSSTVSPGSATQLTLTGVGGEPGASSNGKVFYIDGNLWLHNLSLFSLALKHDAGGTRVTFVVKGNIYFSDNLLLTNKNQDGVAFIAIKDSAVADSGNIYFGDSVFGTLEEMDAFMYAENDFIDRNLSAAGSSVIKVLGMMSAGNQVNVQRDNGVHHTKLELTFDPRIANGSLELPGLPRVHRSGTVRTMEVLSVFEVEAP